jgi:hypothetical protein
MDYMDIIARSLRHAWRYRALWAFGFFVCASGGSNGISSKWDAEDIKWLKHLDLKFDPGLIALLVTLMLALALLIWVLSVLSEGALIHGICNAERGLAVQFNDCLSIGAAKFLRLFGIMFLATAAVFGSLLTLVVFVVPTYFISAVLGVLMTLVALPALLAAILVIICVEGWAIRYAVIDDADWSGSIGQGWRLFKTNIGKSVGVAFSSLLSQLFLWCAIAIGLALLAIPFIITAQRDFTSSLITGGLVGLVIIVLACGVLGTLSSSIWTLGFLRLTTGAGDQELRVDGTLPDA